MTPPSDLSPSGLNPSGLSLDPSVQSNMASPSSPVLNEEQLLDAVMQASALQQQGNTEDAIAIYRQIYQSDPDGQMGMVAQKALESLGVEAAEVTTVEPIALYESTIEAQSQGSRKRNRLQTLRNLPIRRKQLLALFTSEAISLVGLVGVGTVLIVSGLRNQLLSQSQSELSLTQERYNIKINQMGFGFRGQSDNPAIFEAARSGQGNEAVVKILQNEVKARKIEYATLVDRNGKIVAGANAVRTGQSFNPNGLVTRVFQTGDQIKTTEIVKDSELQLEKPPLPESFQGGDALIRYTVTPVKDPVSRAIVGALVSGDIVNGKLPIVEGAIEAFDGGYSAVYELTSDGKLHLATSIEKLGDRVNPREPLTDLTLIQRALKSDKPVSQRTVLKGQTLAFSAKSLRNNDGQVVAVLVRGTPETAMNKLLRESLSVQLLGSLVVIILDILLAFLISRAIGEPIARLRESADALAQGDLKRRAEVMSTDEIGQLAVAFNQMAVNIEDQTTRAQTLAEERRQEAENQRLVAERLQERVIALLLDIDGASRGDLTVRATVTDDEMGSVADAFNATLLSLRQLVTQVQVVSQDVTTSAITSDGSMTQLAQSAADQSQSIATALRSVEVMAKSIQTVASSAQNAATIAREASASASQGGTAMEETVSSINTLRSNVAETAKKVKHLTESAQEISKIVALISEISAKTNLLAFNASIEAVRAGENGEGFKIVADEVRRLAEQVTGATKEIEQLVTGIQSETADVLTMMERGTAQVVKSTQLVGETRQTLTNLVTISQQIDGLVASISDNTTSQISQADEVSQTMDSIAQLAANTTSESERTSGILKQLVAVAEDLRSSVASFKVGE
jgi:twitching motility protein PilJ